MFAQVKNALPLVKLGHQHSTQPTRPMRRWLPLLLILVLLLHLAVAWWLQKAPASVPPATIPIILSKPQADLAVPVPTPKLAPAPAHSTPIALATKPAAPLPAPAQSPILSHPSHAKPEPEPKIEAKTEPKAKPKPEPAKPSTKAVSMVSAPKQKAHATAAPNLVQTSENTLLALAPQAQTRVATAQPAAAAEPAAPPEPAPTSISVPMHATPAKPEPQPAPSETLPAAEDKSPKLLRQTPARYPKASRERGEQGRVWLRLHIGSNGRVQESQVVDGGSGFPRLDAAAEDAVQDWLFAPGIRAGQAQPMWVKLPVDFVLE